MTACARLTLLSLLLCAGIALTPSAAAADVLGDVVRATTRLSEQEASQAAMLARSRSGLLRVEKSAQGRLLGADFAALDDAAKAARLAARLNALRDIQAPLRQQLHALPLAEQQVALAVGRGGEVLQQTVGDLATRGRIVREGGLPTLAAIGTYGSEAATEVQRLQIALSADDVVRTVPGIPRPRVEDFGKVIQRLGEGSWTFWRSYVRPNWKVLAGSGLVAAYLYDPEAFQDAAGNLTSYATAEFTKLGIRVAEGAGQGVVRGASEVVTNYQMTQWAILALGLALCSLFFRRVRYFAAKPFTWLNRSPAETQPKVSGDNA